MSINRKNIKGLKEIKKEYFEMGHEKFVRIYGKCDVFTGLTPEVDSFLNHVIKENKKWIKQK